MPVIKITILPQEYGKKAEIAKTFTEELHRITNIPKDSILVFFDETSHENAAKAGVMMDKRMKSE
ncbi:MAG: tautomerase family protein [Bacteroidales bacterium]